MSASPLPDASLGDRLFGLFQRVLPTRWLSGLVHRLTQIRQPAFKDLLIRIFLRGFTIDLAEAEHADIRQYRSFNHFFTRALKPDARPLDADPQAFLSPVDGTISQFGRIEGGRILQAKGHDYSVQELLANDPLAAAFADGAFCTIYLAPYNYHRIHMPVAGQLRQWTYVPGRLFSVNAATARVLPRLFARNERLNACFDTPAGPMVLSMIGALFVGSLETVWSGQVTPPHRRYALPQAQRPPQRVALARGAEMGRFNMGSTVILLCARDAVSWDASLSPGRPVRMGQALGRWRAAGEL